MKKTGRRNQIQRSAFGDREVAGQTSSLGLGGWNFSRSILRQYEVSRRMNRLQPLIFLKLWQEEALSPERRIESKQMRYQVRIQLALTCLKFIPSLWIASGGAVGKLMTKEIHPAGTLMLERVGRSTLRFIQGGMTPGAVIKNVQNRFKLTLGTIISRGRKIHTATRVGRMRAGIVGGINYQLYDPLPGQDMAFLVVPPQIQNRNIYPRLQWLRQRATDIGIKNVQYLVKLTPDTVTGRERRIHSKNFACPMDASLSKKANNKIHWTVSMRAPASMEIHVRRTCIDIHRIQLALSRLKLIPSIWIVSGGAVGKLIAKEFHPAATLSGERVGRSTLRFIPSGMTPGAGIRNIYGFVNIRYSMANWNPVFRNNGLATPNLGATLPARDLALTWVPPPVRNRTIYLLLRWSRQKSTDIGIKNVQRRVKLTPETVTGRERTIRQILGKYQRPEENQTGKRLRNYPESNPIRDSEIVSPAKWLTVEGERMSSPIFGKCRRPRKNAAPAPRGRLTKIDISMAIHRRELGQTRRAGNPPEGMTPKPPEDQFAGMRLEHRAGLPDLVFQAPEFRFKQEKQPEKPPVEGKHSAPIDEAALADRITTKVAQKLARELPEQPLNVLATEVYQMIERRLGIEKDWRGIS